MSSRKSRGILKLRTGNKKVARYDIFRLGTLSVRLKGHWNSDMGTREDQFFEIATLEVAEKNFLPAIWGKAFSAAMGDQQKVVALYLKFRVEQLENEYQALRAKIISGEAVTCLRCGSEVNPLKVPRTDQATLFLLVCCFVIPGIIYEKMTKGFKHTCPKCGNVLLVTKL